MQNPVPDYYGEKIGSVADYRRWLLGSNTILNSFMSLNGGYLKSLWYRLSLRWALDLLFFHRQLIRGFGNVRSFSKNHIQILAQWSAILPESMKWNLPGPGMSSFRTRPSILSGKWQRCQWQPKRNLNPSSAHDRENKGEEGDVLIKLASTGPCFKIDVVILCRRVNEQKKKRKEDI